MSDLLGRRRLFVASCLAALLAYLTMLLGQGLPVMVMGCVLRGGVPGGVGNARRAVR